MLKQAMATTPTVQFVIEGHVDSVPNGQVLSEHRAGAVKAALIGNGVDVSAGSSRWGTERPGGCSRVARQ